MRYFKKLVGVSSSIVAVLAVGGIPGCGNVSGGDSEPTAADSETVAAAEVINSSGRAFVRADLFDSAERARILEEAADDTQPLTAEKLAAQLRGQMLANDTWYIEKEPPLELARKILAGDAIQSTPESTPQEGRRIIGADNRTHTTVAYNLAPSTYLGFSQIGCTANLIGTRSAVTAAHCVFETRDPLTEGRVALEALGQHGRLLHSRMSIGGWVDDSENVAHVLHDCSPAAECFAPEPARSSVDPRKAFAESSDFSARR